ncbi:MAG: lysophospholipid acyltransferase family protein [Planctomycetes bacterium]|nr:lysophospholipid acyltransferase family protein [Planctomycetota bacterium]
MRTARSIKYFSEWLALKVAVSALRVLPSRARAWLLSGAARVAGSLVFDGIARKNLRIAFGDAVAPGFRREIRRANARAIGRMLSEWVDYQKNGPALAARAVYTDETLVFLDRALAAGRGAVVVTPHFGNWELFPAHLAARGYRGAVVGRSPKNPRLARELVGMRARAGVETLDALRQPRAILRTLQSGGIVGLLPDLDSKRAAGEFVPFFGKPAWTPIGPAHLAVMANAPLLTAYMISSGDRYCLTFEPAVMPDPNIKDKKSEILRLTRAWAERFEAKIRANPHQWVWMHDRFATTPDKAAERRRRRMGAAADRADATESPT